MYNKNLIFLATLSIILFIGCGGSPVDDESKEQFKPVEAKASTNKTIIETGQNINFFATGNGTYAWYNENGKLLSKEQSFNRAFFQEGNYKTILKVTDTSGNITSSEVNVKVNRMSTYPIDPNNEPPTANASISSYEICTGEGVRFFGDESSDNDGSIVGYSWRDMDGIELSTESSFSRGFPYAGTYHKTLTVTDDKGATHSKTVDLIVQECFVNTPPISNAGEDQNISIPNVVVLDGSISTDPDGDLLTYQWTLISQPEGSVANIIDNSLVNPTFTADKTGEYILQLIVNDGTINSDPDTVKIILEPEIINGSVAGTVIDAVSGDNITNLIFNIREGANNQIGDIFKTITVLSGNYTTSLPAGAYTIEAIADGYITGYFTINSIAGEVNDGQNHALSAVLLDGEIRIILTWNENPNDLDSHLIGPNGEGSRFHVYFANKSEGNSTLDLDDITSYGPETITITQQHDGDYIYYIYNYSANSLDELSASGAKVEIYKGSNLLQTYNVPLGDGYYWTVFSINGNTFTSINTIGEEPTEE